VAVTFTGDQIGRAVSLLAHLPGAAERAMARSINRALEKARTIGARAVVKAYRIKVGRVKKGMGRPIRATRTSIAGAFLASGRRPTLYQFSPRPAKPGTGRKGGPPLRVAVRKRNQRRRLPDAFVFRGLNANLLIGREDPDRMMKSNPTKHRIQGLYGPAIPQMLGTEHSTKAMEEAAQETLATRLEHEIGRALDRAAR